MSMTVLEMIAVGVILIFLMGFSIVSINDLRKDMQVYSKNQKNLRPLKKTKKEISSNGKLR